MIPSADPIAPRPRWYVPALTGAGVRKVILLAAVSSLITLLFFPSLAFFRFDYKPGDIAIMDYKSPFDVASGGVVIRKGEMVVRDGQVVTDAEVRKLKAVEEAMGRKSSVLQAAGFFAFTAVFIFMSYFFASRSIRGFSRGPKDLFLLAVILTGVLVMLRLSDSMAPVMKEIFPAVPSSVYKFMIPVAVGPMLARLLLNSETALVFAAVASIMTGFFMGGSLDMTAYSLIGGVVAAMGVGRCTHRSLVIKAGLILGAVNGITLLSIAALKGAAAFYEPFFIVLAGFINGLFTAVLAVGTAPVLEAAFQYTTNIRLLEISRMDHPLLKELAMRAPGTYHHSIVIGTLVEAAAESIGANPLLARVAAYYHDVGKLRMPAYFIENISEENRHDKLAPSMSALILTNHIKEGVELARAHRLGPEIIDVIRQHHGTSLISYFYQKAKSMEQVEGKTVDEGSYRYPGPKPQTKEAGIVMLADAIEAASKSLEDPTPDRIQWLSERIVNKIFSDGQLDECELTLKDLHAITRSFNRVFAGVYHQRINYPEPECISKEEGIEGLGAEHKGGGEDKRGEDKKNGRDRLKRLGAQ